MQTNTARSFIKDLLPQEFRPKEFEQACNFRCGQPITSYLRSDYRLIDYPGGWKT